jgi:hypothetical protein
VNPFSNHFLHDWADLLAHLRGNTLMSFKKTPGSEQARSMTLFLEVLPIVVASFLIIRLSDDVMAWRSSASTNAGLISKLAENGLIKSERVAKAMQRVLPLFTTMRCNFGPLLQLLYSYRVLTIFPPR